MEQFLILISAIAFLAYLIPNSPKKYCAIVGWTSIIFSLFLDLPTYFAENNFMYPTMALLGIPFLVITIPLLLEENKQIMQLSRAAAVAFLIFAPFAYISPVGNWLINEVVSQMNWIFTLIGYPATLIDWNMFMHNNFRVEIILACTGIQSIAIMLGVVWAVPTTMRQKILSFLIIAPTIYILNLMRNTFVVISYTDQWFPYLPEIASNGEFGYESFFWGHNVICELGALAALIMIAYLLFRLIPDLGVFADELITVYIKKIREGVDKGKKFFGVQKN